MRKLDDNRFDKHRIGHPMGPIPPEFRRHCGAFRIPMKQGVALGTSLFEQQTVQLHVIASRAIDGSDDPHEQWDHVSVSTTTRCPTWGEMCFVKEIFFYPNEVVMQLHPHADCHINNHPYCLHLWRPIAAEIPLPPPILVGLKQLNI